MPTSVRTHITERDLCPEKKPLHWGSKYPYALPVPFLILGAVVGVLLKNGLMLCIVPLLFYAVAGMALGIISIYRLCCWWSSSRNPYLYYLFWGGVIAIGIIVIATFPWVK